MQEENEDEDALRGMDRDAEPGAAEPPDREGEQEHALHHRLRNDPWLVQVVNAEEQAVDDPVRPAERTPHPGQQETAEQQLLAEHRVEHHHDHDDREQPPRAVEGGLARGGADGTPRSSGQRAR